MSVSRPAPSPRKPRPNTSTGPSRQGERSTVERLDPRVLLASVTVVADRADAGIGSTGTFSFAGDVSIRVGDNGTNANERAAVFPFKLPVLPAGATITSATANFTLDFIANGKSLTGGADVYGLGSRTLPAVLASDYFHGAYGTDATDALAIQNNLAINTTPAGTLSLSAGGSASLKTYLQSQYAAGAAGKFAFLRINPQAPQITSRYWVFKTADSTVASAKPSITLTYEVPSPVPAAPSNLGSVTTGASTVKLTWADNANNETAFAIEKSTDGVTFTPAGTVGANATTYDVAGLSADTKYFFRVRAINGSTASANTPVVSNTTLPAFTRTLWIDKTYTGATSNGGFATPYKTIAAAMATAVAGDGLVLRGGTYYETVSMKSGTPTAPVTLMSQPGERAIVSGFSAISGWSAIGSGVYKTTLNYSPNTLYVGSRPMDLSRSPNEGWWTAPTVTQDATANTTTIVDPAHLAGIASLVGGTVQAHFASGNDYKSATILSHDTVTGTVVIGRISGLANNDHYLIKNKAALLDRAGEWAVLPGATAGTYDVLFRPVNAADLNTTQARKSASRQILVANSGHDIVIRGLEVTGNLGHGIEVTGNATNVVLRDNVLHNNGANGLWVRYATNITIRNNVSVGNRSTGIGVSSVQHVVIDGNEVAYNTVDGIVAAGDISGKTPGAAGFNPSSDIVISNNYIHHQLGYAHADGIQMYRWVSDIHVLSNFIYNNGQGMMTEQVDGAEFGGNLVWNTAAFNLIFGHSNSNNWSVHNNTIGGAGYGPYNMSGVGYSMRENITLTTVGIPSATANGYSGDYNLYYNPTSTRVIRIASPAKNYTSIATFYADTGFDQHSAIGDPQFGSAPLINTAIDDIHSSTTSSLVLRSITGFAVGDKIQINGDGVVRTVTSVDAATRRIGIDVPLLGLPMSMSWTVENWKTQSNFTYNFTLGAASPGKTLGAAGGPVGSLVNASAYQAGDFNADGKRDLPSVAGEITAGLPNPSNWAPPSF